MIAEQNSILCLITLSACLLSPPTKADLVVFHAEFDDPPVAQSGGSNIAPVEATAVGFVDGQGGRALRLTDDERIVYALPAGLPAEAGSLELFFRADFPQDAKSPARTILRISGGDAQDLEFYYVPVGPSWRFRLQDSLFAQTGSRSIAQGEWVHLLLTWDSTLEPRALTRLYINGSGGRAYGYTPPPTALTTIALGGAGPLEISVDALAVY
ncbi:MAG: LamG-like jellyroll fold domain-containing protein, partial [Kiritimatiellia bacterium]